MKKFLLLCFSFAFTLNVWAQERVITGRVTSTEDGSSLPGVNVVVKGTTNGSVTDADGKYSLTIPSSGANLVFSFIGLKTSEVAIGERTIIDVQLGLDVTQLSEIVVTGTGVATEKRKLAIAVETITSEKMPAAPTASIDQALVGKIAGAQISSVSGSPGAQAQILLRGINTLQRGTQPMILVDGVQLFNTTLNTLDLSAVERVEVVQGAAAATIYGAQGANGVIQVFTKRGKKGKVNIDFSSSITQNEYLNVGNVRKATLHGFATDASGNVLASRSDANGDPLPPTPLGLDPLTLQYDGSLIYDALNPIGKADKPYTGNLKYYDHFNQFFQSASTINNSVRVSGANDKVDYAFSVSNNHQDSNVKNGGYNDRSNFTSNIGIELAKGLTLRSTTQLAYTKNTVNYFIYGVFNSRPFVDFNAKNTQGDYAANFGGASGVNGFNPNYWTNYSSNVVKTIDIIQNFNLNYKFNKFVELDTKYGINYQRSEQIFSRDNETRNRTVADSNGDPSTGYNFTSYFGTGAYGVGFVDALTGEIDNYSNQSTFQNWISKATISFDFQKDFNLDLPIKTSTLIGFDWRKNETVNYATYAAGLPVDKPYTPAFAGTYRAVAGLVPGTNIPLTGTIPFATYGYLVNQKIDYKDFVGIEAGFRSDYSSAFGAGSKPFTFPRGAAYFRISGLDLWDNSGISKVLLEWKIRAAYGEAGIQPNAFDRYVTVPANPIGNESGLKFPVISSNPNLSVEVSKETEIGTDMNFNVLDNTSWLNNINLSFTYWKRTTDNAIWNLDVAPSSGSGQVRTNAFSLASNGIQASLSTQIYRSSNFTWNFTANFTKSSSEITAVTSLGEVVLTSAAGSTGYALSPGKKIGQLSGYLGLHSVNEVDPATGQPYIAAANQSLYSVASNGWVVKNSTKQPYFTSNPSSFGDPNPTFNMAFINDFTYKGFLSFGFQVDWVHGSHLYNQTKEWMYRDGIHSDYNTPITINGETGAWTAFYRGVYAQVSRNGTKNYFYEDASFLRLRNVNVAVDFAKLTKLPFRTLQLVLTGRNLWTHTSYTGMDPEISSGTTNSSWDRAVDHNTLPNFKSYQIGLNIGF
jgi:TonB-dependent starch-binding outer membrane protein SusC